MEGFHVHVSNGTSAEPEKLKTTVAFLKFDIDGEPAKHWNYLKPGMSYDLTIEVRVSNWPKGASVLSLTPVTIDIRERDWLPSFRFEKPEGDGPFIRTGTWPGGSGGGSFVRCKAIRVPLRSLNSTTRAIAGMLQL